MQLACSLSLLLLPDEQLYPAGLGYSLTEAIMDRHTSDICTSLVDFQIFDSWLRPGSQARNYSDMSGIAVNSEFGIELGYAIYCPSIDATTR